MIQKPEWFPFDPAKFFSDSVVDSMTTTELGATLRLLGRQWLDGWIPGDLHTLARLCRLDEEQMAEAWKVLETFFPALGPGKRANRWLFVKREAIIAELERKSDEGTRLARKRWDTVRNADRNPTRNADGNAPRMPDAIPAGLQEQIGAEQTGAEQRGAKAPPPAMRTASGDEPPRGLHPLDYAKGLLENLNLGASPAVLTVVADAICRLAKQDGVDEAQATHRMLQLAQAARERGDKVDRFWFEDGDWATTSPKEKTKLGQRMEQSLAAIDRA